MSPQFQNQLLYVENAKETDGTVWQTVIHRLLVATVIMQLLMCLSTYEFAPHPTLGLTAHVLPAISLKAQDPVMSVLSFLPVGCIIYLKHFISSYRSFAYYFQHSEDQLLGGEKGRHHRRKGRLSEYGQELFQAHSWLPDWKWTKEELRTLAELRVTHPKLGDIVPELREKKDDDGEKKVKPRRKRRPWHRSSHDRREDRDSRRDEKGRRRKGSSNGRDERDDDRRDDRGSRSRYKSRGKRR